MRHVGGELCIPHASIVSLLPDGGPDAETPRPGAKCRSFLDDALTGTGWRLIRSESVVLKKSALYIAQLHVANLRTWGRAMISQFRHSTNVRWLNSKATWARFHPDVKKQVWFTTPQDA